MTMQTGASGDERAPLTLGGDQPPGSDDVSQTLTELNGGATEPLSQDAASAAVDEGFDGGRTEDESGGEEGEQTSFDLAAVFCYLVLTWREPGEGRVLPLHQRLRFDEEGGEIDIYDIDLPDGLRLIFPHPFCELSPDLEGGCVPVELVDFFLEEHELHRDDVLFAMAQEVFVLSFVSPDALNQLVEDGVVPRGLAFSVPGSDKESSSSEDPVDPDGGFSMGDPDLDEDE